MLGGCAGVGGRVLLRHAELQASVFDMARSGQSLGHLLSKHKDKGGVAELSQCNVSQAVHQHNCYPFLFFPALNFLLAVPPQRTGEGWEWFRVPPLHLVQHASVRMSACTW